MDINYIVTFKFNTFSTNILSKDQTDLVISLTPFHTNVTILKPLPY